MLPAWTVWALVMSYGTGMGIIGTLGLQYGVKAARQERKRAMAAGETVQEATGGLLPGHDAERQRSDLLTQGKWALDQAAANARSLLQQGREGSRAAEAAEATAWCLVGFTEALSTVLEVLASE